MRFSRPSTGTVLGALALFIALGGTAFAAGATVVNIADPTTPADVAHVNSSGSLETAGSSTVSGFVGPTTPKTPFWGLQLLPTNTYTTLIGANKATVALTRLSLDNLYTQTNSAPMNVGVLEEGGSATTCSNSSGLLSIGSYDVPAGQTFADVMGSPIVVKPFLAGDVWCLIAFVSIKGNPSSYIEPTVSWSGYVTAGTLPPPAIAETAGKLGETSRLVR